MTRNNYFYIAYIKDNLAITETPSVTYVWDGIVYHQISMQDPNRMKKGKYNFFVSRRQAEEFVQMHYEGLLREGREGKMYA